MKNLFLTTIKSYTVVRDDSLGAAMRETPVPFAILVGMFLAVFPFIPW